MSETPAVAPAAVPETFALVGHEPVTRPVGARGKVLLALGAHAEAPGWRRLLRAEGFEVADAADGESTVRALMAAEVDVLVGGAQLPDLGGLDLLARARAVHPELSVILVSGRRDLDTAVEAMERGAMRYLTRAVAPDELVDLVRAGVRLRREARRRSHPVTLPRAEAHAGLRFADADSLATAFEQAMGGAHLAFQPIVSCAGRAPVAYEALLRSRDPRLPSPLAMLDAAEILGRLAVLGRRVRAMAAQAVSVMPAGARLFVNLHPGDLDDPDLYDPAAPLTRLAHRVTIEVTERARLDDQRAARVQLERLRALGYRVAVDDLGAGYAGLASVAALHPETVKLDMSLVRDVDRNPVSARIIRALAAVCGEMGIELVAEGVETRAERDTLLGLGCDLLQGFLFAQPAASFVTPTADRFGA